MKVSVIVPTLNEEKAIGRVLKDMPTNGINEILVVDSSTDNTAKIAESFGTKVILSSSMGYGTALQTGVEKSNGDVVVYIDGDYTYDPKEIHKLVQPILHDECDVVLGDRFNGGMHHGSMDFLNRFGNRILSLIFSILFAKKVNDTQCGFRAIRKRFLKGLSHADGGMPYVTEQLIKLIRRGARVTEVPITYRNRIGKSKLNAVTDGFRILKSLLREFFNP